MRKPLLPPLTPIWKRLKQPNQVKRPFAVLASTSDGGTLSYQWYKDDVAMEGATEAAYTIASVVPEDAGSYKVVAVNTKGNATATATSTVCALTIDGGISYTNIA